MTMNEWIKCSERLPDTVVKCLGYREIMQTYSIVFFSSAGRWMFAYEPEYASDITHWMPLPEPPEEN